MQLIALNVSSWTPTFLRQFWFATKTNTLPKFSSSPLKSYLPNRKGSSSNHHFSGAMSNFRGVIKANWYNILSLKSRKFELTTNVKYCQISERWIRSINKTWVDYKYVTCLNLDMFFGSFLNLSNLANKNTSPSATVRSPKPTLEHELWENCPYNS